jgi:hypothetical protein
MKGGRVLESGFSKRKLILVQQIMVFSGRAGAAGWIPCCSILLRVASQTAGISASKSGRGGWALIFSGRYPVGFTEGGGSIVVVIRELLPGSATNPACPAVISVEPVFTLCCPGQSNSDFSDSKLLILMKI